VDLDHRRATQLLNASMTFARLILKRYGELPPFGFVMDREGLVFREVLEVPRLPAEPARLWKLLAEHMAARVGRGALQAVAMVANVTLAEPLADGFTDAMVLTIEQESGSALSVTVPYKIYGGHLHNLLPRRIAFGALHAEDTVCRMFAAKSSPKVS
jgi:hypothetical protein